MLTRRQTLTTLLSGAAAALAAPAYAQNFGGTAEWRQSYDAVQQRSRIVRSTTPMISPTAMQSTEVALQRYREIQAAGGWAPVGSERLRLGSRGPAVAALRNRLIVSGDLDPSAAGGQTYDSFVEQAVRRFQARHGLTLTGALNPGTITAMNVPVETRIRQLELNIVRLRAYSGDLGRRYVVVNIPAAMVETVENGVVHTRHAAGVGKIDRQSPILQTRIPEVNFNPTWTVPASIIRKDLIPKMRREPTYLDENRIRVIGPNGQIIPSQSINWNTDEATRFTFRQDPGGEFNSLGFVRINIPSPHGVYMHDTPAKGIFGDDYRFVSSAACACRTCATMCSGCSRRRRAGTAPASTRPSSPASASTRRSLAACRCSGSTSPHGRPPRATSTSATTSTRRTASAACRWPRRRAAPTRTSSRRPRGAEGFCPDDWVKPAARRG